MPREQKVGLVSALGTSFEIIQALIKEVEKLGGTENDLRQLLNPGLPILAEVADLIVLPTKIVWERTIEIDHSQTYQERVESFGLTLSQIPKLYPITPRPGKSRVKLALVRFGRAVEVGEAEEAISELGLEHASVEEAIAFGGKFPHVVYKLDHVMALGGVKFSEPRSPVSEAHLPLYGRVGNKIFIEALSLSWSGSAPGSIVLSTHQFFSRTWRGCCLLCRQRG